MQIMDLMARQADHEQKMRELQERFGNATRRAIEEISTEPFYHRYPMYSTDALQLSSRKKSAALSTTIRNRVSTRTLIGATHHPSDDMTRPTPDGADKTPMA